MIQKYYENCLFFSDYPWDYIKDVTANLKIYLYLPDFQDPPDPLKLIGEYA